MSKRITRSASAPSKKDEPKEEAVTKSAKVTKAAKPKAAKAGRPKKAEAEPTVSDDDNDDEASAETIYEFTANDIKGKPVSLDKYKGHVCIIVNVASRCGHTKVNYEQLVELHKKYADKKGLRILAFPCNQFGAQEPGTPDAICKFVAKYNVKFDMFEKINVNGANSHPLYTFLNSKLPDPNPKGKGDKIKWNFTKFIIDDEGKPVERFSSPTKPLTLVDTLEKYW